jgi:hypothetical protein
VLSLLFCLATRPVYAGPPAGVSAAVVDTAWEPVLWADAMLVAGMTTVLTGPDGREYLASVGFAALSANASPTERMNARRVAETKAKAAIARFVGSTVDTTTSVETERVTVQTTVDDVQAQRVAHARRVFRELTTERAQQMLREVRVLGSWTTDEGQTVAVLVSAPVPER